MISVLSIGLHRVLAADAVVALVGQGGDTKDIPSVFPVQIPKGAPVPAVTINRLFERKEGGETTAVIAVTCMGKTVQDIETLGATLVDEIDGTKDFAFADMAEITFDKAGPDVTGFDAERGLFLRQIEFVVTW